MESGWQVGGDEQTLAAPKRYMTLPSPSVRNPMRADLAKNIFKERGEKVRFGSAFRIGWMSAACGGALALWRVLSTWHVVRYMARARS